MDYDTAIAVFASRGRLVTHDETGAVILVGDEEKLLTPAQVTSSAAMIVRADPDTQQVYASGQDDETEAEYSLPAELEDETRSCQECGALDCEGDCKCSDCGTVLSFGQCPHCCPPRECNGCGSYFTPVGVESLCHVCLEMPETPDTNTASGQVESDQTEVTHGGGTMNFHICTTDGRNKWAGADGFCSQCRPINVAGNTLTPAEAEELFGDTIYDIFDEFGGEAAFEQSVNDIIAARIAGHPGNSVPNRLTRQVLDRVQGTERLLQEYEEYLEQKFNIRLELVDVDGPDGDPVPMRYHDYTYYRPQEAPRPRYRQAVIPGLIDTMNTVTGLDPATVRTYRWQAAAEERRLHRQTAANAVRSTRNIKMLWVSRENPSERGFTIIGPNTEENRGVAAEYQAAGIQAGYKVEFELV